jgi:hypothetical protein
VNGPSKKVLEEFGCSGTPVRLAGGQGNTWRAGDVVLKQDDLVSVAYTAVVIQSLPQAGYRLASSLEPKDSVWTVEGWAGYSFVPGTFFPGKFVEERFMVSRQFHRDLRFLPNAEFLGEQSDPWTVAQQMAFGNRDWEASSEIAPLLELLGSFEDAKATVWQIIYADIAGNFLFEPGLAPAIIDLTFKWSPAGFAEVVMAVDIVLWEGVSLDDCLRCLSPKEISLIPLAIKRRLLEIDTLHRLGGRPESIFEQVPAYENFIREFLKKHPPGKR